MRINFNTKTYIAVHILQLPYIRISKKWTGCDDCLRTRFKFFKVETDYKTIDYWYG